jgi:hypothetical protein
VADGGLFELQNLQSDCGDDLKSRRGDVQRRGEVAMKILILILGLLATPAFGQYTIGQWTTSVTVAVATAATPTFSPVAGTYSSAQTVTISTATTLAVLCYTTDGSTPTETANLCSGGTTATYSTPITVSTTKTVKAIATLAGYTDSSVGSAAYTISGGGHSFALVHSPTLCGTASSFVNPITCTIPSTVAGNSVLIFYSFISAATLPTSYSPAATCVPTPGNGSTNSFTGLCIISNVSGGVTSVSIIPSNNYTSSSVMAVEVSGLVTSSPVDTSVGVTAPLSNSAGASSTGSVTPSNANDVIIGYAGEAGTGLVSVGSGFTVIGESSVYSAAPTWAEYKVVSSTGTYPGSINQSVNFSIFDSGTVALKLQ